LPKKAFELLGANKLGENVGEIDPRRGFCCAKVLFAAFL